MSKPAKPDHTEANPPESFEQALAELEGLVAKMDQPDLGLDRLLGDYRRGASLVRYCRDRLVQVKAEISQIEMGLQDTEGDE